MLSITQDFKEKQGLSGDKWYEAHVVENDDRKHPDKMMLGRIQARVDVLFDGIADKDLPWAIPTYEHPDGASDITGKFSVPKKKTKVFIKFQQANPAFPMYRGFHVDMLTQMEETKYNYPNRSVIRFQNKAMLIVDTQDNIAYLRNPGNLKIFIDGNVELEINGNVDEQIHGNVRRRIKGNVDERIYGNVVRHIYGNLDEEVDKNRHYHTGGKHTEAVEATIQVYSGGETLVEAGSSYKIEAGPNILENCGNAKGNPGKSKEAAEAVFKKWPGVPGSAKGTNKRNKPTITSAGTPCPDYAKDSQPAVVNSGVPTSNESGTDSGTKSTWDNERTW